MRCGFTFRFCLSFRDVEELLLEHESGHLRGYSQVVRVSLAKPMPISSVAAVRGPVTSGHLDEVFLTIKGEHH